MFPRENRGISVSVQKTSFEILTLKKVGLDKSWNYQNVFSPYTRIYIPIDGEGEVVSGGKTYTLKKGNIYVIPTMTGFSCSCEKSLDKIFAHVSLTCEDGADVFWGVDRVLSIPDEKNYLDRLLTLFESDSVNAVIETRHLLLSILVKVTEANGVMLGGIKNYSPLVKNAMEYINENLSASLTVKEVAEKLFISVITLQKRFKKETLKSVGKYIDERLLTACAKELAEGKLNIGEISDKYGFCDRFYFSRKFSEFYGTSPKRYAKPSRT